jgi:sodium/bile acid cotransporter 7
MIERLRRLVLGFDRYLLAILGTVALASLLPARGETAAVVSDVSQGAIALLFFLYGAKLSSRAAIDGLRSWRLHLTVTTSTFVLFPLIGLACRLLDPWLLPPSLYFGVMFMCVLPSTVQSSIAFTSIARGNVPAAICSASLSNLAGIALTPLLAALFLGSSVDVTPSEVGRIAAQLLLPFVVGQLTRRWIGAFLESRPRETGLVDRGSVLLVVYSAFSAGVVGGIWHQITAAQLIAVLAVDAGILALVLTTTTWASRSLGFPLADRIVVIFCGSKKSIATGIPMAAVLFAGRDVSLIVLPAMLFHQIQLMVCAVLSRRYARSYDEALAAGQPVVEGALVETRPVLRAEPAQWSAVLPAQMGVPAARGADVHDSRSVDRLGPHAHGQ